ncbi:hypothetical protein [Pandoraea commovens]|uniref:Uncharacterized protein n=1 Tax=Pandoraea commovens TaxID=2508289 RepID=A0ABY5QLR5_9BURK|nr:hypothetical protein [Pandoraea commovens]UVA81756.1 hypothetical protein NTU39_12515 [Pandoraea commovens]
MAGATRRPQRPRFPSGCDRRTRVVDDDGDDDDVDAPEAEEAEGDDEAPARWALAGSASVCMIPRYQKAPCPAFSFMPGSWATDRQFL